MHTKYFLIIILISEITAYNNFADIGCGTRTPKREAKIVGGNAADKGEFPWLVSITRRGGHFCGGTLINSKFIMTAAHCLCSGIGTEILKASNIKVTMAQHDLTDKNNEAYEMPLNSVTIHPNYICNKASNDIAILELENEIVWSDTVSPACLPISAEQNRHNTLDNKLATVAGWGWTNEDSSKGGRAKVLQKAQVNVIEIEQCRKWYKSQGKKTKIQNTQICAGHEKGGVDACWADSGGPLMVNTGKSNQMMVVGVVSTGIGCARPYLPGLYTRVSEYIPWIREVITK